MAIKINNVIVVDDSRNFSNVNGIFTTANSSYGVAGQVLTSNGAGTFWGTTQGGTVTQITAGTGLSGGIITGTGTITLNTAYVETINSNNSFFLGGANASLYARLANSTFTGTIVLPTLTSIGTVSSTEIGYLDGVTSAIQTQINAKGNVNQVIAGTGLSGGTITTTGTIGLNTSGVAAGTYTAHGFSVDVYGRVTSTSAFRSATTSVQGMVSLDATVTNSSNTVAATPGAVKIAYDLAATKGVGVVTSITGSTGVTIGGTAAVPTVAIAQAVGTGSSVQFGSLGVGTAASGTAGEIRATNEITAYYSSDERLKENVSVISNPIEIVKQIRGVYFDWTSEHIKNRGGEDGYFVRKHDIGVIAQEVEKVLPELVVERDDGFKAVKYEKLVALLIESIKELSTQVNGLQKEVVALKGKI